MRRGKRGGWAGYLGGGALEGLEDSVEEVEEEAAVLGAEVHAALVREAVHD